MLPCCLGNCHRKNAISHLCAGSNEDPTMKTLKNSWRLFGTEGEWNRAGGEWPEGRNKPRRGMEKTADSTANLMVPPEPLCPIWAQIQGVPLRPHKVREQTLSHPKEAPAAAPTPTGYNGGHFGTAVPLGARAA